MRSTAKVAFLQSLDVVRASARRLGACLADEGILEDPTDIFYLTADEVCAGRWEGAGERIEFRRQRRREYEGLDMSVTWQGMPTPAPVRSREASDEVLQGVGASPGVVEGRARVISTPGDALIEPGEILVAHTTDPSWASILFLSSGLVCDIGGLLSHAAVVARELGIPCVADTKVATKVLRTGDLCRVDGSAGRVEVLRRAASGPVSEPTLC
jgi:pyruvate,water dikinase